MLRDDPALIDLPHPVRVDGAFGQRMEDALFGADFWLALKPYLGDETLPTEWILTHAPGVYKLARESSNFPGTTNLGPWASRAPEGARRCYSAPNPEAGSRPNDSEGMNGR